MLIAGGGFNHLLVFMARYIFEKESYALNSSRYTLQFQVGIFGIILTCALVMQLRGVRAQDISGPHGLVLYCNPLGKWVYYVS